MSRREEIERINVIRAKRRMVLDAIDDVVKENIREYLRGYSEEGGTKSPEEFLKEMDKYLDDIVEAHDELCEIVQDFYRDQLFGDEEGYDEDD